MPITKIFILSLFLMLTACGGGSSGNNTVELPTPTPPAPTNPDLVSSVKLTASTIDDGLAHSINAEISPATAKNISLNWTSNDTSVATIDEDGLLTPLKDGIVQVTATATDGSDISGSVDVPIQLAGTLVAEADDIIAAINNATAESIIYISGGSYFFNSTIRLTKSGSEGAMLQLRASPYDSARPLFDFSAMSENSQNRGLVLSGSYWHIYGIDIYKAGDNCLNISGHNNIIEFSRFFECADTGLQLGGGASDNLILNCDSYYNADSSLENADGFAAKLDVGSGNKFVGCRAWNNLDDGWDGYLRGADNVTTTYENCWAIDNGRLKDGSIGKGDGNGFKTGGSDGKDLKHNASYLRCIAAGNVHDGFDHNSNRGSVTILHGAAHANGKNINFSNSNIAASLTLKNSISFNGQTNDALNATNTDITTNSWQDGLTSSSADFVSIDLQLLKGPRKPDGSLPDVDYFKLVQGSLLIDAGSDLDLPFNGSTADIGPFEYSNN